MKKNDHPCDRCGGKPDREFVYTEVLIHYPKRRMQAWVGVLCKHCRRHLAAFFEMQNKKPSK